MPRYTQYALYEGKGLTTAFSGKYAVTQFEAHKYMIKRASEEMQRFGNDNTTQDPLWYGQIPPENGVYLIYGLPGPDKSVVRVIRWWKGWLGNVSEPLFTIEIREMERVDSEVKLVTNSEPREIVKCSTQSRTIVRDLQNPRDALLFEIEKRRNANLEAQISKSLP